MLRNVRDETAAPGGSAAALHLGRIERAETPRVAARGFALDARPCVCTPKKLLPRLCIRSRVSNWHVLAVPRPDSVTPGGVHLRSASVSLSGRTGIGLPPPCWSSRGQDAPGWGLQRQRFIFSRFWRLEVQVTVWTVPLPPEASLLWPTRTLVVVLDCPS